MPKYLTILIFTVILSIWSPLPSHAHKIRVFAWPQEQRIMVEAFFPHDRPVKQGKVEVIKVADNSLLLSGTTDNLGGFSFPWPDAEQFTSLRIVVSASEGHKNEFLLTSQDLTGQQTTSPASPVSLSEDINNEQLVELVDVMLEKKLGPIRRSLARAEEHKPDMQDIAGGIGYLVGLAGLSVWLRERKKNKK